MIQPEIWIAGASLVVSVCAFWLAWRADSRARVAARAQMFLTLRTRFLSVLETLPSKYMDSDWDASIPEHRAAAIRYWHHAYDEWYVTNRLDDKLLKSLWEQYYSKAVLGGLNHYGLRKTLIEMKKTNGYRAELWKDYFEELDVIWAKNHPPDGKKCAGIECVHNRSEESYELERG